MQTPFVVQGNVILLVLKDMPIVTASQVVNRTFGQTPSIAGGAVSSALKETPAALSASPDCANFDTSRSSYSVMEIEDDE